MLRIDDQAHRTDTGRQRNANEDSLFTRAPLFVVADGMGGAQAGEVASKTAAESFDRELPQAPPECRSVVSSVQRESALLDLAAVQASVPLSKLPLRTKLRSSRASSCLMKNHTPAPVRTPVMRTVASAMSSGYLRASPDQTWRLIGRDVGNSP